MVTEFLIRLFIRNFAQTADAKVRLGYGMLAGCVGVAANLLLFAIKMTIGIMVGSVAVAADAVNNLSDTGSAIVTLFGFKMAAMPPDTKHPFGHGRIEYIAGLIVAVVIVAVGLNFLKESVMRIIHPSRVEADNLILSILAATLLVKIWLFFFFRVIGRKINSQVILAASFDSLSDLLTTSLVLIAIVIGRYTTFPVDGCAGVAVAGLVIWGGIGILRETSSPLLGERPDHRLVEELQRRLLTCPAIAGVHDIVIHNYGPNRYFATAHAEVNRTEDMLKMHDILEAAEVEIARSMPVRLLLHCDPFDIKDPTVKMWRARTEEAVSSRDCNFKLYDFRLDESSATPHLRFHLLIPRNYEMSEEDITAALQSAMRSFEPNLELDVTYTNGFV